MPRPANRCAPTSASRHAFIQHLTAHVERLAVDLPTLEIFNSMLMPDGGRSMSFGRTLNVIHANPTAPADYLIKPLK